MFLLSGIGQDQAAFIGYPLLPMAGQFNRAHTTRT
jgi:hypothetical protein